MDDDALTAALTDACTRLQVPGAALGLLRGPDRLVVTAGVRAAGRSEHVRPATRFPAGSITQALTAQVVLDAHERGELDLDVPAPVRAVLLVRLGLAGASAPRRTARRATPWPRGAR